MNKWTHSICGICWDMKHPERKPARLKDAEKETCCFCGRSHKSGIYLRHDPVGLRCKGVHYEEDE